MTGLVYTKDKMVKVLTKTIRNATIATTITLLTPAVSANPTTYDCVRYGTASHLLPVSGRQTTTNILPGNTMTFAFDNLPPSTINSPTPLIQTLASQRPKTDPRRVSINIRCDEFAPTDGIADAPLAQFPPTTGFMTDATPLPAAPGFKLTSKKGSGTKNCTIWLGMDHEVLTWVATTNEPDTYKPKTIWWTETTNYEYIIHYDGSWSIERVPPGSYVHINATDVRCVLRALQLEINVTPEIDFGMTTAGTATSGEIVIIITSGSDVPSGTYWLKTPDSNSATPINLGGGTVKILEGTTELKQYADYIITSRIIRLNATLNATGATPGPAETPLTVTMRVN